MKKRREKLIAIGLTALGYGSIFGAAAWRVLRQKHRARAVPDSTHADENSQPVVQEDLKDGIAVSPPQNGDDLESLSPQTPGNAPLDRLAGEAAFEEKKVSSLQSGSKSAPSKMPPPDSPAQSWSHESETVVEILQHQNLGNERLIGWSKPAPDRLPVPTFAPAVMAFGIVVFAMGLATVWYVCVTGSIIFALAAWRWTGELQGE